MFDHRVGTVTFSHILLFLQTSILNWIHSFLTYQFIYVFSIGNILCKFYLQFYHIIWHYAYQCRWMKVGKKHIKSHQIKMIELEFGKYNNVDSIIMGDLKALKQNNKKVIEKKK